MKPEATKPTRTRQPKQSVARRTRKCQKEPRGRYKLQKDYDFLIVCTHMTAPHAARSLVFSPWRQPGA
ncbi:hypothetical protein BDW69DRAFT_89369 [Aspergillus filifer]